MSMYGELEMVIADYVGYEEDGALLPNGKVAVDYDCADIVLYDNLIDECTLHLDGVPLEMLSADAKYCIIEWESIMAGKPVSIVKEDI